MEKPEFRHAYDDRRIDRAYRLVISEGRSLRKAHEQTRASLGMLKRFSARDGWVAEREAWKVREDAAMAELNHLAAIDSEEPQGVHDSTDPDVSASLGGKNAIVVVLRRQQKFWTRIETRVQELFDDFEKSAQSKGKAMNVGQLMALLTLAEKVSNGIRRAYGIPDVSKLEIEDKTPVAARHAELIRKRQRESKRESGLVN